jgi:hypothetical protein
MNWRTLAIFLILANLLYWAWSTWIVQPEIMGLEDHGIADIPELELVIRKETKAPPVKQSQQRSDPIIPTPGLSNSASSTLSSGSNTVCKKIGPFINEYDAVEAATWLETEGIKSEKKLGLDMIWLGYWVYLPRYAEREKAVEVVTDLRAGGIKDMFIEIAPPNRNAVSLGLYRNRSGAEIRSRQIKAKGYPARITNKEREQAVYWLETQVGPDRDIPLDELEAPMGQVSRVVIKDCG